MIRLLLRIVVVSLSLVCLTAVRAQLPDRTLLFNVSDAGVSKTITNWGLDTAWLNADNVRRGAIYMGAPQVDVIRFSFTGDWPLNNGDLGASALSEFNDRMAIVNAYTDSHTALYLNNDSPTYDASFIGGDGRIEPGSWATLINATRQRCVNSGRTVLAVSPCNEPDNSYEQGSVSRLGDVSWQLRNTYGANFSGVKIYGASTLNCDNANSWYNTLNGWNYLEAGCTHQLAGSFNSYAGFFQNVQANGDLGVNDELHNVMEAMVGAEYGMDAGIWWGTAERARGEFVKASDGQRLAYAEHRPNWTAASVYRGTSGAVQAFVGESERQSLPTTYRFFSKDRDVFYDGDGPRRDYTVTTTGDGTYWSAAHRNAEKVVNITWGADVPPLINGRYIIVNRSSGKALLVPGGNTGNGVALQHGTYTGAPYQQWDVQPLPNTFGGDYSYYTLKAAHSGVTADLNNWSYNNGGVIQQWNGGTNTLEQWYFQYVSNGWFKIRNRWSNKVLGTNGTQIVQFDDLGTFGQQWRFIPATVSTYDFVAPVAPSGLTAVANALSVQLNWNTTAASDLAGYTVLRSTNSGGPYDTIARGLTNTTFTDKSANQNKAYYYVVKAADRSLNTSANSAQVSATPTCGPTQVARYAFDAATDDSSINANHPIVINGSPTFVSGKYGPAMDLNGSGQYAMLPANLFVSVTNFTIAMWVNWDGGSAWQRIFDFGNDTTQYMFLTPSSGGGTLRFAITTNNYAAEQILETSPLPVGQWRHVAITRSGNTARLYTNGVLAATATINIPLATFNPALNYLGASQYSGDPFFNGRLDELFIYNYALNDAEIAKLALNQPPPPSVPTSISSVLAGNTLTFSWPSNYVGCRLESNSVGLAVTSAWFTVLGSGATNQFSVPINTAQSNVFFRIVYP